MGQSKQLLSIEGKPLLSLMTETCASAKLGDIVVVLGAREQAHRDVIKDLPIHIVQNSNWESGIGSSIKTGLRHIIEHWKGAEAVLILLCDQPHLTANHLISLFNAYQNTGGTIVASSYGNTIGVPAIFDQTLFQDLLNLKDNEGAKKIIQSNREEATLVPFQGGDVDLDTLEDYNTFIGG